MTNDYAIEIIYETKIPGEVKKYKTVSQKFCVSFDCRYIEKLDDRKVTTCCLIELPSKKIYSGASIKNHCDISSDWLGRRWAYKRAILMIWIIWMQLGKIDLPFKPFWQMFRKALAENQIYLSERMAKENV